MQKGKIMRKLATKRAMNRYDKHGCPRCGDKTARRGVVLTTGDVICPSCVNVLDKAVGQVQLFQPHHMKPEVAADRAYFEANPGDDWRVRPVHSQDEFRELNAAAKDRHAATHGAVVEFDFGPSPVVVVLNLAPGKRLRIMASEEPTADIIRHHLAAVRAADVVPGQQVAANWARLEMADQMEDPFAPALAMHEARRAVRQ
jgi:ribosomal protein L37AE/L43A